MLLNLLDDKVPHLAESHREAVLPRLTKWFDICPWRTAIAGGLGVTVEGTD